MRPMACQPKNRFTRSRITADRCWISMAAGPSTRSTSVAGSGDASPEPEPIWRGQLIFSGSLWAAISGPAMSAQRAMISAEAKPCALSASLKVAPSSSESGRGKLRAGLLIQGGLMPSSAHERTSEIARAEESRARPRRFVGLVRPPPASITVALAQGREIGPVPRLAVGDHAAADDREGGGALLRALRGTLADGGGARGGKPRRCAARLGRAWVLRARPQPACLRARRGE